MIVFSIYLRDMKKYLAFWLFKIVNDNKTAFVVSE